MSVPPNTLGLGANDDIVSTTGVYSFTLIFYCGSNGGDTKNDDGLGIIPLEKVIAELANALTTINTHLNDKTYFIGKQITLADIFLVSALLY